MKNYKVRRPIDFEGKKIESLSFNFEKMTRKEYKRCIKEARIRNKKDMSAVPIFSETFRLVFAGVSAGVPTEAMFSLYPKDIYGVSEAVYAFFFGGDADNIDFEDDDEDENGVYKLKDPIEFNGETIKEFEFDFDGVNYLKYKQCENEARKLNSKKEVMLTPSDNENFQLCFAAKAAGMENKVMFDLSLRDALNICFMVRNFLSDGDSDEEEETETESISITPRGRQERNVRTEAN